MPDDRNDLSFNHSVCECTGGPEFYAFEDINGERRCTTCMCLERQAKSVWETRAAAA